MENRVKRVVFELNCPDQAAAFGIAFWWVVAIAVGATAPALLLTLAERRAARTAATPTATVSVGGTPV